jgi:hypothetical protein
MAQDPCGLHNMKAAKGRLKRCIRLVNACKMSTSRENKGSKGTGRIEGPQRNQSRNFKMTES